MHFQVDKMTLQTLKLQANSFFFNFHFYNLNKQLEQ
jgi:hypothetical protein